MTGTAARAGAGASQILAAAERAILAAMASAGTQAIRGTVPPALARRKVEAAAAAALGAASTRLHPLYRTSAEQVTGKPGPLPDAPAQVATAVLCAQQDAAVAFGAVLAAAVPGASGVRMPPPSSPYRRIAVSARRQGTPGKAAASVLAAIERRGLTGWVSYQGRRWPLAAYGARVVRAATVQLARMPALSEVTARRDALLHEHEAAVAAAWAGTARHLGTRGAVRAFRADSRVTAAGDPAAARRWRQEAARSAAAAWAAGITRTPGWPHLQAALGAMVLDGMAEGEADAMLLAASRQHVAGFSAAAAFTAARTRLEGGTAVTGQARDAEAALTAAAAAALARALAGARAGAGEDEMAADAEDAARGGGWVSRLADWSLWAALGAGALALYQRVSAGQFTGQGVLVSWLASASACPRCELNAAGSPYAPVDVPAFPAHPSCRCFLSSDTEIPLSLLAASLVGAA